MKRKHLQATLGTFLFAPLSLAVAITPNEWQFRQTMEVPQAGLIRFSLPAATLDAARPDLADLRLLDPSGREVPYLTDRPLPQAESVLPAKEFHASIEGSVTRLQIVTGTKATLRSISLVAPGRGEFIKPVRVEGSHDGQRWRALAERAPIFRMAGGATQLTVPVPEGAWEFLRVTVDDSRSAPVPFTGAMLLTGAITAPTEPMPLTIKSRDENPGVTRLALDLGAMNLTPAEVHIDTSDPLFARSVTVAVPEVNGDNITEAKVAQSIIYRMDVGGRAESHPDFTIDRQIPTRELLLLIANGDSPPLTITGVRAERRSVQIMFSASQTGQYTVLTGNRECASPNYDLSALAGDLKKAQGKAPGALSALVRNSDYKAADALASISFNGAKIDVGGWALRKSVKAAGQGTQELEIDVDVLSGASGDLRDLRLVSEDRQIPFLLERTSISRALALPQILANDSKRPNWSIWSFKLPKARLPIGRIAAMPGPGIFEREFRLYETVSDGRSEDYERTLASAKESQVPNQKPREIIFELNSAPLTDRLVLETDNGDNPPMQLSGFRAFYPVTRLVFKAPSGAPLWLYYGNAEASAPHYDLTLVARELLRSERSEASLGPEEVLDARAVATSDTLTGPSRYIFWGVLALVVLGLLAVVARFIPKAEQKEGP